MSNLIIWSNWIIKWFFNKMSWVKYFLVCCWSCSLDYIVLMSSYWILWQFSMLWYYHFLIFNSWDCTHFLSNITLISFFFYLFCCLKAFKYSALLHLHCLLAFLIVKDEDKTSIQRVEIQWFVWNVSSIWKVVLPL